MESSRRNTPFSTVGVLLFLFSVPMTGCPGGAGSAGSDAVVGSIDAGPDLTITLDGSEKNDASQSDGSVVATVAFSAPVELHADYDLRRLAVGDLDGDGRPDIVVGGSDDGSPREGFGVWFGKGGRSFGAQTAISPLGGYGAGEWNPGVLLADFNGDHLLDIAFSRGSDSHYVINLGGRRFSTTIDVPYPSFMHPTTVYALAAGDFNRDGSDDLIFGGTPNTNTGWDSRAFVDLADGKGGFQMPIAYGANTPFQLRTADLDLDGWIDVISSGFPVMEAEVLFNDKGTLSTSVFLLHPVGSIVVADMDGDGLPDIIGSVDFGPNRPHGPSFTRNLGNRNFAPTRVISPDESGPCLVGDMNHDGRPDVVCEGSDRFFILFNLGGGAFSEPLDILQGIFGLTRPFAVADLDGDKKPDIALDAGKSVVVYYNDTP